MIRRSALLSIALLCADTATSFVPHQRHHHHSVQKLNTRTSNAQSPLHSKPIDSSFDPIGFTDASDIASFDQLPRSALIAAVSTAIFTATPSVANAAGPDWGIFEGRTGSLLHPIMMASMLLFSLSTAWLGFNWRRQRTLGDDISALKKGLPKFSGDLQVAIETASSAEEVDMGYLTSLKAAVPLNREVNELLAERKELSSQGNKDKHFSQGALLAFLGTSFAIEGPLNTYARAGKLFPGPHLYAGAGLVVLWAAAAACVPAMQKGNDTARSIHIAANSVGIGLFGWQVISGWPILMKVIEKTQWP